MCKAEQELCLDACAKPHLLEGCQTQVLQQTSNEDDRVRSWTAGVRCNLAVTLK